MLVQESGRSGGRRGRNLRPYVVAEDPDCRKLEVFGGRPLLGAETSSEASRGLRGRPRFLCTMVHPSVSSDSTVECSDNDGESRSPVGTHLGTEFSTFRGRPRPRTRPVVCEEPDGVGELVGMVEVADFDFGGRPRRFGFCTVTCTSEITGFKRSTVTVSVFSPN